MLSDGRVLVAGGLTSGDAALSDAELYDPANDTWAEAGAMFVSRVGHTATTLSGGGVLIAGGQAGGVTNSTLEIFDPAANRFQSLAQKR